MQLHFNKNVYEQTRPKQPRRSGVMSLEIGTSRASTSRTSKRGLYQYDSIYILVILFKPVAMYP